MSSTVRKIDNHEVEIDRTNKLIHISDKSGKLLMSLTEKELDFGLGIMKKIKRFFDEKGGF